MDLTTVAVIYCIAVGIFFLGLWLFYGRREFSLFEDARRKSTFLCAKCDLIYSAAGRPEEWKCPRCGHENAHLRY